MTRSSRTAASGCRSSLQTAPTEWVVPQVAASVGTAFCDGSRLVADGSPVLMMGRPLRAADVDALAEAAPPAALAEICEIWRLLRVVEACCVSGPRA